MIESCHISHCGMVSHFSLVTAVSFVGYLAKHVQGLLTEYVAQPGVQCYKDLAGNLKKV